MPFFKYLFQTMYIKHTNINITCNPIDLGYAPSFLPIIFVLYSKMFNVDINVIILYVLFITTFYTSHSLYIRGSWIIKKNNDLRTFFIHFIISFAYSLSSLNTKVFDSKQNLIWKQWCTCPIFILHISQTIALAWK